MQSCCECVFVYIFFQLSKRRTNTVRDLSRNSFFFFQQTNNILKPVRSCKSQNIVNFAKTKQNIQEYKITAIALRSFRITIINVGVLARIFLTCKLIFTHLLTRKRLGTSQISGTENILTQETMEPIISFHRKYILYTRR